MDPLNQPPQVMYPKGGGIFLMSEVQRLTANVADLIDVLAQRDMRIAQLEAELAAATGQATNVVKLDQPA